MIHQTQRSDLRTLFNLLEKKLRDLDIQHLTIFKGERGYRVMECEADQLIDAQEFESIEDALSSYIINGESSNNSQGAK